VLPPNWYLVRSICQRFGSAERCGFQGRWYELSGKHQMIRERIVRLLAFPLPIRSSR
jgi:hypothetical protein